MGWTFTKARDPEILLKIVKLVYSDYAGMSKEMIKQIFDSFEYVTVEFK